MEQKNDTLSVEDVVFMLLETFKSNGTFDEIRRHCITDIDAKPTYQNWKQRIETNVNKFLSRVKYTPELNKNTVREQLRKYLLNGPETRDIEEGADRILSQVLASCSLSIIEPKITVAIDEYSGIQNETPTVELSGRLNTPQKVSGLTSFILLRNRSEVYLD